MVSFVKTIDNTFGEKLRVCSLDTEFWNQANIYSTLVGINDPKLKVFPIGRVESIETKGFYKFDLVLFVFRVLDFGEQEAEKFALACEPPGTIFSKWIDWLVNLRFLSSLHLITFEDVVIIWHKRIIILRLYKIVSEYYPIFGETSFEIKLFIIKSMSEWS